MEMSYTEVRIESKDPVKVTRRSGLTGIINTRTIENGSVETIKEWLAGEGYIQDIMPEVSKDDREFLMSGITPEEWEAMT